MKTVKITEILDYYDGIQIFAARDPIGGHYVGAMIDTVGDHDRYLVVGVKPERLTELQAGRVDLRTLLLEMPEGEWYITMPEGTIDDSQALTPQPGPLAESGYLPGDGYFLDCKELPGNEAIRSALERGKVVALTGQVEQVNRSTGEWSLLTDQGVQTGRTAPNGPGLDGLKVGKRYRFKCAETTELDPLWRDRKTLYLQNITPEIILPSPEEDAAITAGMDDDPDTFESDDVWFAGAKPTSEVLPHMLENRKSTRGRQKPPTKREIHIRLDPDIIEHFRQSGPGWQTRINDSLQMTVEAERKKNAGATGDPGAQ